MKNVSKCLLLIASIITAQPSQDVIFQNFRTNWLFYCLAYAEEIEFLKTDKTKIISAWAQPEGCTPYNHGPYFRKLEIKRLKARLKTLQKKLTKV